MYAQSNTLTVPNSLTPAKWCHCVLMGSCEFVYLVGCFLKFLKFFYKSEGLNCITYTILSSVIEIGGRHNWIVCTSCFHYSDFSFDFNIFSVLGPGL